MATRTVTGIFLDAEDQPMVGLAVTVRLSPNYYDAAGHRVTTPAITATTDDGGVISVDLVVGARYVVQATGQKAFAIIVTAGDGPASLESLHASGDVTTPDVDLVQIAIEGALADYALDADLAAESATRATADTALAASLAQEISARSDADADLTAALNAEIAYRDLQVDNLFTELAAGDSVNATAIVAEATARASADTANTTAITTEATTRASADTALQANITAEATARLGGDTTLTTALAAHTGNTNNPHATTAVQVGADPTGTASAAVAAHVAASDPHSGYYNLARGDARYMQLLAAVRPQVVTGAWFEAGLATNVSTLVPVLGTLYLVPVFVAQAATWNAVRFGVTAIGSADNIIRVGLYASDAAANKPGALVASLGSVSNPTVAEQVLTISQAVSPGVYWLGLLTTGTTAPTIRAAISPRRDILGAATTAITDNIGTLAMSGQSSLPATATPGTNGSFAPLLQYRIGSL